MRIINKWLQYLIISFVLTFISINITLAQNSAVENTQPNPLTCGTIIQSEFSAQYQLDIYTITLAPGDKLSLTTSSIGNLLTMRLVIFEPVTNRVIAFSGEFSSYVQLRQNPSLETDVLSARGTYIIWVANFTNGGRSGGDTAASKATGPTGGLGVYTLNVGCLLANGTQIAPGTSITPPTQPPASPTEVPQGVINGIPSLPAVDFSNAILASLTMGQFVSGQIPAEGNAIICFTFNNDAPQTFDLQFLRRAGNLNLGLGAISPSHKVVFQTVMISSDLLLTRFHVDEIGQHTLCIFKADVNPPATPQPTDFQIQGTLTK